MAQKRKLSKLKFKQIISSNWHTEQKKLMSSVYGLTEDGDVYRHGVEGWKELDQGRGRSAASAAASAARALDKFEGLDEEDVF